MKFSPMEQEVCAATLVSAMWPVWPGLELSVETIRPPGARSGAHTAPFTRNFKGNNASCKPRARSPHLSTASLHGKGCLQKRFETEAGGSEALPEATASSPFHPPSLLPLLLALPQVDKQSYKIILKCAISQSLQDPEKPAVFPFLNCRDFS